MSVILAFRKLRQENCYTFTDSLDHRERESPYQKQNKASKATKKHGKPQISFTQVFLLSTPKIAWHRC